MKRLLTLLHSTAERSKFYRITVEFLWKLMEKIIHVFNKCTQKTVHPMKLPRLKRKKLKEDPKQAEKRVRKLAYYDENVQTLCKHGEPVEILAFVCQ